MVGGRKGMRRITSSDFENAKIDRENSLKNDPCHVPTLSKHLLGCSLGRLSLSERKNLRICLKKVIVEIEIDISKM